MAHEYIEGGANFMPIDGIPKRTDFLRQKWMTIEASRLAQGLPISMRLKKIDTRDVGSHAIVQIYGILPSGRKCHIFAMYNPFFEVVGMPGELPDITKKRFENHVRKNHQLEPLQAAAAVHTFSARPLMSGDVQEFPDGVVRYYFNTIKEMNSGLVAAETVINIVNGNAETDVLNPSPVAPILAPLIYLGSNLPASAHVTRGICDAVKNKTQPPMSPPHPHLSVSMGTKTQQNRILQFIYMLRVNEWITVKNYFNTAPSCERCQNDKNKRKKCTFAKWRWANADCDCTPLERITKQAQARFDYTKESILLCTSLLPCGEYPFHGKDAYRNKSRANIKQFVDKDCPALTLDEQDLTPEFDLVYDIETYGNKIVQESGKPPFGDDKSTHLMMISMILYMRGSTTPVATVLISDTKLNAYSEFLNKMQLRADDEDYSNTERTLAKNTLNHIASAFPNGWIVFRTPYRDTASILRAFAVVFSAFDPDAFVDFNGHDYDMPFIKDKLEQVWTNDSEDIIAFCMAMNSFSAGNKPLHWMWETYPANVDGTAEITNKHFNLDACVCVDVMMQLKRIHPIGVPDPDQLGAFSGRLDAYLRHYKISGKVEHDFLTMWSAYERKQTIPLTWSGWYCLWDSAGTYRLLTETGLLMAREPFATEGFCSNDAAYHRGDGMRVEGAVFAEATQRGYTYSYETKVATSPKIKGAWVKPPIPGFATGCAGAITAGVDADDYAVGPTDGVPLADYDFVSQYPNAAIARNSSWETASEDEDAVKRAAQRLGCSVRVIDCEFKDNVWGAVPVWTVYTDDPARAGILPTIVRRWLARRERMKNDDFTAMKAAEGLLRATPINLVAVRKHLSRADPRWGVGDKSDEILLSAEFTQALARKRKSCDREQTAVKKLANTAYGKCAQSEHNRLLRMVVGGSITATARESIRICAAMAGEDLTTAGAYMKMQAINPTTATLAAYEIVSQKRLLQERKRNAPCNTHDYTDTDSVYISLRQAGITAFTRSMVGLEGEELANALTALRDYSYAYAENLGHSMNKRLREYYGNSSLVVKLEGLHMRRLFIRSKCYFSLKIGSPATAPAPKWSSDSVKLETFESVYNCCGVKIKKRNTPPLITRYIMWLVNHAFALIPFGTSPDFDLFTRKIVQDFLGNASLYKNAPLPTHKDFAESAKFNPAAMNVAVKTFVARVKRLEDEFIERGEHAPAWTSPPMPGTRFKFVVCGCAQVVRLDGHRMNLSVGQRMVSLEHFEHMLKTSTPLVLDYLYYAEKHVATMLGEILAHLPCYDNVAVSVGDDITDDQIAECTQKRSAAASKSIIVLLKQEMGYTDRNLSEAKRGWKNICGGLLADTPVARAFAKTLTIVATSAHDASSLLTTLRQRSDDNDDLATALLKDAEISTLRRIKMTQGYYTESSLLRQLRKHKIDPCEHYKKMGIAEYLRREKGIGSRNMNFCACAPLISSVMMEMQMKISAAREDVIVNARRGREACDTLAVQLLNALDIGIPPSTEIQSTPILTILNKAVDWYITCLHARANMTTMCGHLDNIQRKRKGVK